MGGDRAAGRERARNGAPRVVQAARASKHRNIEGYLPTIHVPTCIIWGEEDRITPLEVAQRFHALMPESDLFLVPRCGHAPMLEQPETFNRILEAWLLQRELCEQRIILGEGAIA